MRTVLANASRPSMLSSRAFWLQFASSPRNGVGVAAGEMNSRRQRPAPAAMSPCHNGKQPILGRGYSRTLGFLPGSDVRVELQNETHEPRMAAAARFRRLGALS